MKRLLVLLCFLVPTISLQASPTLNGPTGLITVPTAESLRYREMNMATDYVLNQETDDYDYYYKFNMGTFKSWELGFVGGTVPSEGVYINAKYYLISDDARYPVSVAIGIQDLTSSTNTDVYMMASKRFEQGFVGHFGFNANFGEEELDPSIMGGVEYIFSDNLSILGDFSGDRREYTFNAGARLFVTETLAIRGSLLDIGNKNRETSYTLGLEYSTFL